MVIFIKVLLAACAALILLFAAVLFLGAFKIRIISDKSRPAVVKAYFWGIGIYTFDPSKEKKEKRLRVKKRAKKKKEKEPEQKPEKEKPKVNIRGIIGYLLDVVKTFSEDFAYKCKFKISALYIHVASDDAARTAVMYGTVSQGVAFLVEFLKNHTDLKIPKKAAIGVDADFLSNKTSVLIDVSAFIRIRKVIALMYKAGLKSPADLKKFFIKPESDEENKENKEIKK